MTQSEAYETCLKLAAQNNWHAVYNAMMEDGFDKSMDYQILLKLWKADSAGEL